MTTTGTGDADRDGAHRPTVFIVDDDEAFRDSLEVLCGSVDLPTRSFPDGAAFLEAWSDEWRGCILLDVRMPGMSGLELQSKLAERDCRLPVLFITGHGDIEMAVSAMKNGAVDFLTKPLRQQDLLDRVHAALRRAETARSQEERVADAQQRLQRLTPREREVFDLVVEGCANKVISHRLDISQRTVELHRSQVMQKMEAESLADLVRLALRAEAGQGRR